MAKSLFIAENPEEEEVARQEFERSDLNLNNLDGSRYLGAFLGTTDEIEEWVWPKAESWAHRVRTLAKISNQYTQLAYAGLGMSLQIEWQYLQRTVPGVGTIIGPI